MDSFPDVFPHLSIMHPTVLYNFGGILGNPLLLIKTAISLQQKQRTTGSKFRNKQSINTLINKIMKTMEITPMAVAEYNGAVAKEKVLKAVKNALKSTFKFLLFISPVYPQVSK